MSAEPLKDCRYKALGLMSGTSLDGLDLALCDLVRKEGSWEFSVIRTDFIPYSESWTENLVGAYATPISELGQLHVEYGEWLGGQVKDFLNGEEIDLIASHGHTTHHDPKNGITNQLGFGQSIANISGVKTVHDFRSQDVELGGEGAPLVPIGDKLLFSEFDGCMNLGGFSNISFEHEKERRAFDICPVNIIMNPIAEELGKPFDANGDLAKSGAVDSKMLSQLQKMMVGFRESRPSLSREWVEEYIDSIINTSIAPENKLRTLVEFAAEEMAFTLNQHSLKNVLLSGGGTYNTFLIDRLRSSKTSCDIIIPNKTIIDFKEAIVFAFLGVLRDLNEVNVLKSVTGASKDSSSGIISIPE